MYVSECKQENDITKVRFFSSVSSFFGRKQITQWFFFLLCAFWCGVYYALFAFGELLIYRSIWRKQRKEFLACHYMYIYVVPCRVVSCRVKTSLKLTCAIQSGWSAFFLSSHKCYLLRFFIRSSLLIFDFKEEEIDALAPLHIIGFLVLVYFFRFLIYVIFRSVYAVIYLYTYFFFLSFFRRVRLLIRLKQV